MRGAVSLLLHLPSTYKQLQSDQNHPAKNAQRVDHQHDLAKKAHYLNHGVHHETSHCLLPQVGQAQDALLKACLVHKGKKYSYYKTLDSFSRLARFAKGKNGGWLYKAP